MVSHEWSFLPSTSLNGAYWRRYRLFFAVLLLSLIGACTFNFFYRQLDWLVFWHLSDYVSIDDTQRSELEQRLIEQLDWHCATQLTAYAEWFREMHRAPQPFSRDYLERNYRRSLEFWQVLMENISPDITELLLSANDAQVAELMRNLERRTRELEKQYVTASWRRVQQRRIDKMEEILERWIGALNREQHKALVRWARELGKSGDEWIKSRRRWQHALAGTLALRGDRQQFAEHIHTLFVEPRQLWPASYRKEYARLETRTLDMLAEVAAAGTPGQQHYFREQLLSWAEDFEQLTCDSPATASRHDIGNTKSKKKKENHQGEGRD